MHPERSDQLGTAPSQRCPDCLTPFAPEDVDRERGFAWCVPCRKAMHLNASVSVAPSLGSGRIQKAEGGGLHVSWRTRLPYDWMRGPFMSTIGTALVGAGLFTLFSGVWRVLPVAALFLGMGGLGLWQGLRALWRCLELVQLRVEGRSLIISDGPLSGRRRQPLDGALVRRLRLIREPIPTIDQGRNPFSPGTMYTLIVELRDGSEQVLARGFLDRTEPLWLALELHRALDLATPVDVRA